MESPLSPQQHGPSLEEELQSLSDYVAGLSASLSNGRLEAGTAADGFRSRMLGSTSGAQGATDAVGEGALGQMVRLQRQIVESTRDRDEAVRRSDKLEGDLSSMKLRVARMDALEAEASSLRREVASLERALERSESVRKAQKQLIDRMRATIVESAGRRAAEEVTGASASLLDEAILRSSFESGAFLDGPGRAALSRLVPSPKAVARSPVRPSSRPRSAHARDRPAATVGSRDRTEAAGRRRRTKAAGKGKSSKIPGRAAWRPGGVAPPPKDASPGKTLPAAAPAALVAKDAEVSAAAAALEAELAAERALMAISLPRDDSFLGLASRPAKKGAPGRKQRRAKRAPAARTKARRRS